MSRPIKSGQNIFEKEWDVLLILDACRVDIMREIVQKRDLGWDVETTESVDTMTGFWMEKTFIDEYRQKMEETIYLCSNPHSESLLRASDFYLLDEIWKYAWDEEIGTCLAEDVTDEAIALRREYPNNQLLIHYMQPHNPFISDLELNTKPPEKENAIDHSDGLDAWDRLEKGEVKKQRVWDAYKENLEYVIDEVERLLRNLDAETVVISSDHGNAIGEWGLYGHPHGMPFSCLRTVPWIELSARDLGECDPQLRVSEEESVDVGQRLEALGYR
jgi:hypothetical protein